MRRHFRESQHVLCLREKYHALQSQDVMVQSSIQFQREKQKQLWRDTGTTSTTGTTGTLNRNADGQASQESFLEEVQELNLISQNLQLESADFLVEEHKSQMETDSLEQGIANLRVRLQQSKAQLKFHLNQTQSLDSWLSLAVPNKTFALQYF